MSLKSSLAALIPPRTPLRYKGELSIALLVGLLAVGLPYGFLIGMVVGTVLFYASKKLHIGFTQN
jgi:hypothetical protein